MTQLDYYTNILSHLFVGAAIAGGIFSLLLFAAMSYYLYPWLRK